MFTGDGFRSRQNTRDGADRDLVVLVCVQSDPDEGIAKLCCHWTNATHLEFRYYVAVALLANNWLLARVTSELVTLGEQKLQPKKRVGINPIVSFTALGIGSLAIQGKSIGLTCQDLRPR